MTVDHPATNEPSVSKPSPALRELWKPGTEKPSKSEVRQDQSTHVLEKTEAAFTCARQLWLPGHLHKITPINILA